MNKYDLLPMRLMQSQVLDPDQLFTPQKVEEEVICWTHTAAYLDRLKTLTLSRKQERESGFPLSKELIEREILIMSGTVQCAEFALEDGVAFNIAGGTHHAFSNRPEGFCLLNDQAVAANYLIRIGKCSKVLIIDLDVHQGNGTAEIFEHNPSVFTFSMHGAKNYPFRKQVSDLDVELPDGVGDEQYLKILQDSLSQIQCSFEVDFIFFQSGVDVLATDKLGRLSLSLDGCKERDRMVFEFARSRRIPLVACMGGGYSADIEEIIEAHVNTYKVAKELFTRAV